MPGYVTSTPSYPGTNMELFIILIPLFFLTAWMYASAGFGGGSTYLALLFLFHVPYTHIPKVALLCNLVVVTGGLYHYIRTRNFSLPLVIPFIITSIPFSYVGGRIPISKEWFLGLLGFSLFVAGVRMLFSNKMVSSEKEVGRNLRWFIGLPLGACLGFISGLVGIGGGIFLAPLLYFLGWGKPKQIAAASSFFIFVNYFSGFLGQWGKQASFMEMSLFLPLLLSVFLGGQMGSKLSSGRLSSLALQRMTGLVILIAAGRIFWGFI